MKAKYKSSRPKAARKTARHAPARHVVRTDSASITRNASRVDGVNVNDLVIITEKVKNNPALAEYTFRANTHWMGGARAQTKILAFTGNGGKTSQRSFTIEADEPSALLGTNHAPSPVEYALAGLGSSFAEWVAYNAAARGIQLEAVDIQLEGGMDLRGSLGVRESGKASDGGKVLRPGFEAIRMVCNLKSDAPPSELKELVEFAKETCPVFDMFRHPVPIAIEIKH